MPVNQTRAHMHRLQPRNPVFPQRQSAYKLVSRAAGGEDPIFLQRQSATSVTRSRWRADRCRCFLRQPRACCCERDVVTNRFSVFGNVSRGEVDPLSIGVLMYPHQNAKRG